MDETLIAELLWYCRTTYGIDLRQVEQRAGSAQRGDLFAEVPGEAWASRDATLVRRAW